MSRTQKTDQEYAPHLVTLAAEFALKCVLRPFLDRRVSRFAAVVIIPDREDLFIYEEAARRLIGAMSRTDEYSREELIVSTRLASSEQPWVLISELKGALKAILFRIAGEPLSDDAMLAIDVEVALSAPTARHYMEAARRVGLRDLLPEHAEFLAGRSLRNVRLATLRRRPMRRVIEGLEKAEPKTADPLPPKPKTDGPTLDDLAGYGQAGEWGKQLATDVRDWKSGLITWSDVDKGILLNGPPGCGKTLFATALANTCDLPVFTASSARWQAMGHLGDMLKAMRSFFDTVNEQKPCIAFIDEFDSFVRRDSANDKNPDYNTQVINALLECLAPAEGRDGVIVIAATNNAAKVDPALLRPGRLEKVIQISLPDGAARLAIFRQHLAMPADQLEDDRLIAATEGWSGADLEKLARDTRRACRKRDGTKISFADVESALPTMIPLPYEDMYRLAVHEAGHAVLALVLDADNLLSVSIVQAVAAGMVDDNLGDTRFKRTFPFLSTEDHFLNQITIRLGGLVAERLVLGSHSTAAGGSHSADLAVATRFATIMEATFAYGATLVSDEEGPGGDLRALRWRDPALAKAVHERLESCRVRAKSLLEYNKDGLLALAERLADKGKLDAAEVKAIVGSVNSSDHGEASVSSRREFA